jgi:hypothetical protein
METDPKTASQRVSSGVLPLGHSEVDAQPHIARSLQNSSFWERLSVSKFPYRHPVLYGSLLELRSFAHRIRSLVKRGDIRPVEIGFVFQQSPFQQHLVRNRRTQARTTDIQKLLSDCPWLSGEDCYLFLQGWIAGEEWHRSLGTAESGGYSRDLYSRSNSATANATPPQATQQSTIRDR